MNQIRTTRWIMCWSRLRDAFGEKELRVLSSQMMQALIKRLQDNVSALAKQKTKGVDVGKIKFVRWMYSIPIMQYGITYSVDRANKRVCSASR